MKPVIKQYAASGKVDRSPSTSPMRCSLLKSVAGDIQSASTLLELEADDAGCGRAPFSDVAAMIGVGGRGVRGEFVVGLTGRLGPQVAGGEQGRSLEESAWERLR